MRNSCIVLYCLVLFLLASCKRNGTASLNEDGPYSRVIVTTTVHTALFRELGAGDAIVDTCEIDDGNPDIERIISMNPDAIFLSPYEGQNFEKIRRLGIPIVEMPDYLEPTPLGRAAWMKHYGRLLGKEREADSLYAAVESAYYALRDSVRERMKVSTAPKPRVFTETKISSTWYVATGHSYIASLIADAGGDYVFKDVEGKGSKPFNPEVVFDKAQDADIWMFKYGASRDKTMAELAADWTNNSHFRAYQTNMVFGCNLSNTRYFEETPFHPELLLRDYINIISPGTLKDSSLRYYKKIQ
jgi:iron complex transport system substrate-binding protein